MNKNNTQRQKKIDERNDFVKGKHGNLLEKHG